MSRPLCPAADSAGYSASVYRQAIEKMGVVVSYTRGVSMRPLIWQGRHYVAIVPPEDLKIGDILLFEQMRRGVTACILHRLIKIEGDVYVTRGDNCLGCERIRREDIIGKVIDIYRNGSSRFYFALRGEHINVEDAKYKRYVRILNSTWPIRRAYFLLRVSLPVRAAKKIVKWIIRR